MQPIGTDLAKLAAQVLRNAPADELPLLAWPLACGKAVAERTRALSFNAGVLRVEVPDSGWRSQLAEFEPRYLAAMRQMIADDEKAEQAIKRIQFVLARPARETK
ncbi:MAG: DciA family protein [Terriglobales bacterium]